MSKQLVLFEIKDRVGYITLNRPEKRNALSFELVKEIKEVFRQAETNTACKIIVIQGSGEAFCAGADLAYLQQLQQFSDEDNLRDSENLMQLFQMIYTSAKTVIAKVNGPALAGGCGLANCCDFTFASARSSFGYTEIRIGFVPAMVMVFLTRKVSEQAARELLLTGEIITADKAQQLGLVNQVMSEEQIDHEVHQFATRLCKNTSSESTAMIKKMLNEVQQLSFEDGMKYAAGMNVKARKSDDCRKGIAAFLNKEKLTW